MLFSSIYPVAFLLASTSTVHGAHTAQLTPHSIEKARPIETITRISTLTQDVLRKDPHFWNASRVEVVKKDIFSPSIVIEMLESYTNLLQNPAIRYNYQLREAKAASRALSSRIQSFGDWWARRRWTTIPRDSTWFDGTLAEGLIDAITNTVHRHVPQMYTMNRHLGIRYGNGQSDQDQAGLYTTLQKDAENATTSLNAAVEGQSKVIPRIEPMVSTIVARARRFADNMEEFYRIVAYCITKMESRIVDDNGGLNLDQKIQTMNDLISQMSDSVFRPSSPFKPRSTIQDLSLDEKFLKLYTRYVLDFLQDGDANTNGSAARQGIHNTYEHFRNGLQITQDIQRVADGFLASAKQTSEMQQHGDVFKWTQFSIEEMATNLGRITLINGFAQALVSNATRLTSDMDKASKRWTDEAAALIARSKGLEPQGEGEPPKLGKRVQTLNPETGLPMTTQYFYEYQIQAPWRMVEDIRRAADQLEYVWSTVVWCEDELSYLNVCEAINSGPKQKAQALQQRFRWPGGRDGQDAPKCDIFSNTLLMKHMCLDEFKFDA